MAMVENSENFPLKLELDTGVHQFRNSDELIQWITDELSYFSWMDEAEKLDPTVESLWRRSKTALTNTKIYAYEAARSKADPRASDNHIHALETTISSALKLNKLITSKNPVATYSKHIAETHGVCVGAHTLLCLMSKVEQDKLHYIKEKGVYYALNFGKNNEETDISLKESALSMQKYWQEKLTELKVEFEGKTASAEQEIERIRDQSEEIALDNHHHSKKLSGEFEHIQESIKNIESEREKKFQEFLAEGKDEIKSFNSDSSIEISNARKEFDDLRKAYNEQLRLKSSVQYWNDKEVSHRKTMIRVGIATFVFAVGTGFLFYYFSKDIAPLKSEALETWRIGVLIVISTLGIWLTRLSSKIFISNLHLQTDAKERQTMMTTYLALSSEGETLPEGDRQLILQSLFRPSATGYIKDEGPSSITDLIGKITLKK